MSDTDRGRVDGTGRRSGGADLRRGALRSRRAGRCHPGAACRRSSDVTDVRVELSARRAEPRGRGRPDGGERHGLKPGDIRRAATTLANGLKVGSLFEEQKVFDVIVNGRRDYFEDPGRIGELLIDTPDGGTVRLDEVADVGMARRSR